MARVRVMYWKEIPVQVQAQDENGTISRQLDPRFQQAADAVAMFDGSAGSDEYLEGWGYGEFSEESGSAGSAADRLVEKINTGMPKDFVARIRDLDRNGERDTTPGAIDHWVEV